MSPLISVVLPTHNRADRLLGAIGSVLAQTVEDLELLVVDNGSTDDTQTVLEKASATDNRVRGIRVDGPLGPAAARNVGIREASGEFIGFIDDDDRWRANKTAVQLDALRAEPGLGAVVCSFEIFDERRRRSVVFRGPVSFPPRALLWSNFALGVMGLVRRSAAGFPLFDESLTTCEDWDYWVRCSEERGLRITGDVLYRVVFHGSAGQSWVDAERRIEGRELFVAKHSDAMSELCRAYHDARLRLMREPRALGRVGLHATFLRTLPRGIRSVVAGEMVAARLGRAIGDPGLGSRTLLRLIRGDL